MGVSRFTFHASRFIDLSLLGAILIIYAASCLYQLNLPGLHYDEAFEAVPAWQLLSGQPVTAFRHSGLVINGQLFPFMTQDYIGAVNTYLALPFIAMLGPTPLALRVMSTLIGAMTLGLAYLLAGQLAGQRRAGLAAALLLAVDPTFIFWNRQGVFVTAITAAIGLAATICWLRRWPGGSAIWSLAGAFLLGLGLYAKFLFLWLIVAVLGAVLLLKLPSLIKLGPPDQDSISPALALIDKSRKIRPAEMIGIVLAFLLGCWPLIAYNLQTGGTFLNLVQHAATSYYGVNNLAFAPNLLERCRQFITLLNASHLWYLGNILSNSLPPLVFGLIFVLVLLKISAGQPGGSNSVTSTITPSRPFTSPAQIALFPFSVIGLVILASIGTISALWVTHFAILMPWPAIAMAIGSWFIIKQPRAEVKDSYFSPLTYPPPRTRAKGSLWAHHAPRTTFQSRRPPRAEGPLEPKAPYRWVGVSRLILAALLGLLVITNLSHVIRYHLALTTSGGLSTHSDAVYDLSAWLAQQPPGPVVAMDWGLTAPVTYLTRGRVTPVEVFGYAWESDAALTTRLNSFIAQPNTLYLWRAPDEIIFDRSAEFKALYRPLNLEETIEDAFYEKSGRPILGVTRLVQAGTPGINPPK